MVAKSILTAGSALTSKILYGSFDLYTARWPPLVQPPGGKKVLRNCSTAPNRTRYSMSYSDMLTSQGDTKLKFR